MHSESLDQIATALAAAQAELAHPAKAHEARVKMKNGSTYTYTYATLPDTIDAIKATLAKHGLSVTQSGIMDGSFRLRTTLMHKSGQWVASDLPLPPGVGAQDLGSAITYARRYALCAIVGIASEDDDDGSAAQAADTRPRQPQKPAAQPAPQQTSRSNGYVARTEMVSRVADVLMKNYASLVRDWSGDTDAEVQRGNVLSLAASKLDELSVGDAPVPEDLLRELGSACKETMAKRSVEAA